MQREAFADLLDVVQLIERQQERLKLKIIQANRSDAFVRTTDLLQSVPGIGPIWACIIASEIGPFERFANADALEFWAGITPDNQESAGRTQSGHITKAGSATLRWALCNAAVCLCRSDVAWAAKRQRLRRKIGKPKANVALGRCLLRTLYAMMRDATPFQKSASTRHTARANRARVRTTSPNRHPRPTLAATTGRSLPRRTAGHHTEGRRETIMSFVRAESSWRHEGRPTFCRPTPRRAGDHDWPSFGPPQRCLRPAAGHRPPRPSYGDGDRDSVNSARPTRTRFYSARNTSGGTMTSRPGDCEEMNAPAASQCPRDAGRTIRFRQEDKTENSETKKASKKERKSKMTKIDP